MTDKREEGFHCEDESVPPGMNEYMKEIPDIIDRIAENCKEDDVGVHLNLSPIPSREEITRMMDMIEDVLFPGFFGNQKVSTNVLKHHIGMEITAIHEKLTAQISKAFIHECNRLGKSCVTCVEQGGRMSVEFLKRIPMIRDMLKGDVKAAFKNDPAARSSDEIIFSYPGIKAIAYYRVAHELWVMKVPIIPRIITEIAHSATGIDIHPGSKIGKDFFIDHGTGTVVGETCEIGNNVVLYQNVTLGSLNFPRDDTGEVIRDLKRHPTVGNNVIIYSGATILGGETRIGDNVVVGGNAWITYSIPDNTKVMAECPALKFMGKGTGKK
jgi:serine O-acetyltransferase